MEENWNKDIEDIENFFKNHKFTDEKIDLAKNVTVANQQKFYYSHIMTIKKNNGNKTFKSHLDRLKKFKEILNSPNKIKSQT